jgi:hypothetical protein
LTLRLTCKLLCSSIAIFFNEIYRKVGDMSDSAIDEYIKFCGKALVGDAEEFRERTTEEVSVELIGSEYERVLCVGAQMVGVSVGYLDVVMQRFERRLVTAAAGVKIELTS